MSEIIVDIPNYAGWSSKKIDQLCSIARRGTAPIYVENSSIKAIGQRCVTHSDFDPSFARPHSEKATSNILEAEINDVLLNSTGTGTIGRSVIFNDSGKYIVDGHVTVLRPHKELVDSRWLNAVLRSKWFQRHLERFCYTGSTNQLELSRTYLNSSSLPVPTEEEQSKIGDVLDSIDTQIRETEAIIAKLQQVKQGLLHDLLTRGVDENGELRPSYEDAPELYKDTPQGFIPKAWVLKSLSSYTSSLITYGIVQAGPHIEGGVPYVRTGDMSGDELVKEGMLCTSEKIAGNYFRSRVETGDIVMAIRATVGKVLPVPAELNGANLTQGTARISPNKSTDKDFLLWAIRHQRTQKAITNEIKGTTFAEITLAALREVLIASPKDKSEQEIIGNRLNTLAEKLNQEVYLLKKLQLKKSGLMDDLLTGKVRVTELLKQK
ncbi:restriction endonuclease subunit S [Vibrio alginolyticus]